MIEINLTNKNTYTVLKQYKNNRFTFQTMSLELLNSGENKTKHKRIRTKEEIDYISCCRARKMVKEYMLCNDFNYFCTLTIKAEDTRFHLEKCIELLRKIFSYCKKLDKNFKYLCVIEPHKKGGFHFHFVTNLIPFELIKFTEEDYTNDKQLPYKLINEIKREKIMYNDYIYHCDYFDKIGWFTCSHIHNKINTSFYILKYISKEFNTRGSEQESVRRYFCSKSLKTADKELFINFDFKRVFGEFKHDKNGNIKCNRFGEKIKQVYNNKYITQVDFDLNELNQFELLEFSKILQMNYQYTGSCELLRKVALLLAEKYNNLVLYNILF